METWSRHNIAFGPQPGVLWIATPAGTLVEVDLETRQAVELLNRRPWVPWDETAGREGCSRGSVPVVTEMDSIVITTLDERPSLLSRIYEIAETWPAFIPHDPVGEALLGRVAEDFPRYCVVATDGDRVVARGLSVPFNAELDGREEMPDKGWDQVLVWAFRDQRHGHSPTTASALEITVDTEYLGRRLSYRMLAALQDAVGRQGHNVLLAPVRPTAKYREPRVTMTDYIRRQGDDGFPTDPWLRVHVKAGGSIQKIAPASMAVSGSLSQWRQWTGLPFDSSGDIDVPGALVPVHCDTAHDRAVYVEPNVWIRHDVKPPTT